MKSVHFSLICILIINVAFVQENHGKLMFDHNRYWRTARDLRLVFHVQHHSTDFVIGIFFVIMNILFSNVF